MTKRQDLVVNQGETFSFVYTKRDSAGAAVDLTGYTARMKVKDAYNGATQASLTTEADSENGTITLGGAAGTVTLAMTAADTAALASEISVASLMLTSLDQSKPQKAYIYDLELITGATVTRELEGRFVVRREVTA